MKILILTVAGMSSRFSRSIGRECLKCIYYENDIKESLLYKMIFDNKAFDKYIIVGGFHYEELSEIINTEFADYSDKIELIYNEHYADYLSGYSLYMGLKCADKYAYDEIVFAEGDLFVDKNSFNKVYDSRTNVITYNTEPIYADKAVVYYYDEKYNIHYIYDTNHQLIEINEPMRGIFNSGQIWKFVDRLRVKDVYGNMALNEWKGTNLNFIQKYFMEIERDQCEAIRLDKWINCNTIDDYKMIQLIE